MTSRRWVPPVVVAALAAGTGGAVAALAGGGVQDPQPVTRAEAFHGTGPSASWSGDAGSIGEVAPLRLATPTDAAGYDAVVEVSYDLRTRPAGPATIDPGADGPAAARWLVRGLEPGTTYRVTTSVNTSSRERGANALRLRNTLLTVELAPGTR